MTSAASLYRNLAELEKRHLVRAVTVGRRSIKELIHPDGRPAHDLVCDDCGHMEHFADDALERVVHDIEAHTRFEVHTYENRPARPLRTLSAPGHRPATECDGAPPEDG